jgi:hypothetical protein
MNFRQAASIVSIVLVTVAVNPAFARDYVPPEPKSIAAKCNKEAGGRYDFQKKQWVVRQSQVAAKNACVDRMTRGR